MIRLKHDPILGTTYYCDEVVLTRLEKRGKAKELDPNKIKKKSNSKFIK